jgi:DNA-binding transcriptional MerR regulator
MKTNELAHRIGISPSLLRKWTDQYREFLSETAAPDPGQEREFTIEDCFVMATVSVLRDDAMPHAAIKEEIAGGTRIEMLPELPSEEIEAARRAVQLVPVDRLHRALDRVDALRTELERVIAERDKALADKEAANKQIADLREELGAARKEAELLREIAERPRKRGLFGF